MKYKLLVLSTGFAMFSMFFGSGNLVFPISVGKESEGHFLLAALGIILTGVLVPFLGVITMMLYKGDNRDFFSTMGKPATFWFPLLALSLMGPFGVLARCIAVSHGSFTLLSPSTSIVAFSLAFCGLIYLVTIKKSKIVPLLGSYLTPFLLILLAVLAICGISFGSSPVTTDHNYLKVFSNGFFQGYQTMDLLAAFFFSTFVIQHLSSHHAGNIEEKATFGIFLRATLVGGFLLSLVYVALVVLGAVYSSDLAGVPPAEMLGVIAEKALGPMAAPVVCLTIILACLTTAVVLASLFADFLQKEVAQNKISDWQAMLVTLAIAFCVSTLEFEGIARFLGPILETAYPAMITLTVVNMANKLWGSPKLRWPVAAAVVLKVCCF